MHARPDSLRTEAPLEAEVVEPEAPIQANLSNTEASLNAEVVEPKFPIQVISALHLEPPLFLSA